MITDKQFYDAAMLLHCDSAVIMTVAEVESSGSGFDKKGRVTQRFEPHVFYRRTNGRYGISDISQQNWSPKNYKISTYVLFEKAYKINPEEAIKSTSWGMFQIMGFNFRLTGYENINEFYNTMHRSENDQLTMFVNFIKNSKLDEFLRKKEWEKFAQAYNGRSYKINKYDEKLKKAYLKYSVNLDI